MDKEKISSFCLGLGADVVGFSSIGDYELKGAMAPDAIMPGVQSIIVTGYREVNGAIESPNNRTSIAARLGMMDLMRKNSYLISRFVEDDFKTKAAPVAPSYPLDMKPPVMGLTGDFSLRHAAVAAGLGVFGRHNLVINPKLGSRIIFTAVLTSLPLKSDERVTEDLCNDCGLCVESCPAQALDEKGKTDMFKCLKVSQPNGIGGLIGYLRSFIKADLDGKKALLKDPAILSLYQASFLGFEYHCFKCIGVCPACLQ
jgi:epoxyqueuosine reductase